MPRILRQIEEAILGTVQEIKDPDGFVRRRFVPNSRGHLDSVLSRYGVGKKLSCYFKEEVLKFSDEQRAYHFVLMGYIANNQGTTKDDEHDDAMKEVFGIRTYKNYKGEIREGRYSISDASNLKLPDIQKLIDRDLGVCSFLEIRVPTKAELGYVDTAKPLPKIDYPGELWKESSL